MKTELEVLSKKLAEALRKELEEVERKRIELREIKFIDMYNGKPWIRRYVYGLKIEDRELCKTIARMLDIIHDDCCHSVEFIAITKNGVYVQYAIPRYNRYGSWVGNDEGYEKLHVVIEMFREKALKVPEKKELLEKLKSLLATLVVTDPADPVEQQKSNARRLIKEIKKKVAEIPSDKREKVTLVVDKYYIDYYRERTFSGVRLDDVLLGVVTRMLNIVYDDCYPYAAEVIVATPRAIYVQFKHDEFYYVTREIRTLESILRSFRRKKASLPRDEDLLEVFRKLVARYASS